jgi:hypothetical protein
MFRIRREQREHFADRARADFEARMAEYFREEWFETFVSLDDAALAAWIHDGVDLAFENGIELEEHVAQLLVLLVFVEAEPGPERLAPGFEAALTDPELEAVGKLVAIAEHLAANAKRDVAPYVFYDELRPVVAQGTELEERDTPEAHAHVEVRP